MSEAKFTKGEWEIVIGDEVSDSTLRVFSGAVCVSYHGHYCQEAIANAHLIAAAPEMYEMLEEFRDFAVRQGWQHVLIDGANKLLAKARGEQDA